MEHSDSQTSNAPAAQPRGSGGDVQSKGIDIPVDDARDREQAGGEASPASSSGATAEE